MTNLQFSRKHLPKLALISLVAVAVGAGAVLALNYKTLKNLQRSPEASPVPATAVEEKQEKIATYSGKIKPSIRPEIAAHYLEDDEGKIIIFLKSGKIESGFLGILEGQTVEVVGEIAKTFEDLSVGGQEGLKVLKVNEVHL